MGILSLTITAQESEFYIGRSFKSRGLRGIAYSTDGDQHLSISFLNNHMMDCIDKNTMYPRLLLLDTKTRGSYNGGVLHITDNIVEIPSRFKVQLYKSNGDPQDGTIDVKLILEYTELLPMGHDTTGVGWSK